MGFRCASSGCANAEQGFLFLYYQRAQTNEQTIHFVKAGLFFSFSQRCPLNIHISIHSTRRTMHMHAWVSLFSHLSPVSLSVSEIGLRNDAVCLRRGWGSTRLRARASTNKQTGELNQPNQPNQPTSCQDISIT